MGRTVYTVLAATLMLSLVGRARAEPPAPAELAADVGAPEQQPLLQKLSLIDSELEIELEAQHQYRLVPPVVVASLGVLPVVGGLVTLAMGGLISFVMPDDGPDDQRPIDLPWVRNSLYVMGAGAAVAAVGLGWLVYRLNHRRVHTKRIRQLQQQRKQLLSPPAAPREPRSAVEVEIAPLLSVHAQGALLSLRF